MSSLRKDLCRSRRARGAPQSSPALPVLSGCPVLANLRNRLGLWALRDPKSPVDESCGPGSPTDEWWCNLRKPQTVLSADRSSRLPVNSLPFRELTPVVRDSGRVCPRPAVSASRTDVCFLSISDHGRIPARPNSRQRTKTLDGRTLSGVNAVAYLGRAVFHSKETGSDQ